MASEVIPITKLKEGDRIDWGGGCESLVYSVHRLDDQRTAVRHQFEGSVWKTDMFWTQQNIRRVKPPKPPKETS